ncbi:MAG: SixA phosphatase family protein [Gemmatimonadales bacterium]
MLLLLIRHAHAGDSNPAKWPDDRERPLTDKGRRIQRKVSRLLRRLDLVPDVVLASPWKRAAQTAAVLAETLDLEHPPVPCEALAEDPDLSRIADFVGDPGASGIVALVGHSPWMEELAAILLAGSATQLRTDFPKSGVMGIDLERVAIGAGELRWFLRPKAAVK